MRNILVVMALVVAACGAGSGGSGSVEDGFDEFAPELARMISGALFGASAKPQAGEIPSVLCPGGGSIALSGNLMVNESYALFSGAAVADRCAAAGFVVSGRAAITASRTASENQVILFNSSLTIEVGGETHEVVIGQLIIQLLTRGAQCYRIIDMRVDGDDPVDVEGGEPMCLAFAY
jgi:hypothetical protein